MDNEETTEINDEDTDISSVHNGANAEQVEVNAKYLKHYRNSVTQYLQHLNGANNLNGRLQPSFFPPNGFWTAEEKDLFFHALSVHSRFRPDLIAAEIPGKTMVDVCVYISMLFEASSKDHRRLSQNAFLPALEVSEEWIAFEENQATAMVFNEATSAQELREEARSMILQDEKEAMRKQKQKSIEAGRDREEEKRRRAAYKKFQADRESHWWQEDFMARLDSVRLRVIDNILQEAEEPRETSLDAIDVGDQGYHTNDSRTAISNAAIDPVLLSMSDPQSEGIGLQETAEIDGPVAAASQGLEECDLSKLSPRSRRRYKKRLHMRRKRAVARGNAVSQSMTRLKPGRKSNWKKIHSPPQVDELPSGTPVPFGEPQPGVEPTLLALDPDDMDEKDEYFDLHAGKEEFEVDLDDTLSHDQEMDASRIYAEFSNNANVHQLHASGATAFYKLKKDLLTHGNDAARLGTLGLGLFHLSNIEKLMNLHGSLSEVPDEIAYCISSETIRLLHGELICFLKELIHRTIAIHEQQRRLKGQSKVWKLGENQMGASPVEEAIDMMGVRKDKQQYFKSMVKRFSASDGMGHFLEEGDGQVSDHSNEEGSTCSSSSSMSAAEKVPPLSIFREIYMPFIWHEASTGSQSLPHFTPPPDASVLGDEIIDANAEADELMEEEELDQRDLELAAIAESQLWARYVHTGETEVDAILDVKPALDAQYWGIRYGQQAGVKSQVFVEDSD